MSFNEFEIDWNKYPNLESACPNCDNEEDLDWALKCAFDNYSKEDLKNMF